MHWFLTPFGLAEMFVSACTILLVYDKISICIARPVVNLLFDKLVVVLEALGLHRVACTACFSKQSSHFLKTFTFQKMLRYIRYCQKYRLQQLL